MYIEQLYTNCLAAASYYIDSNGEAAVIDPIREPGPYLELAEKRGAKIKYIFETHFHADFVSGHLELARKTGATIVFGPGAKADFQIHVGNDGEDFRIGNVTLRLLHTPGHTLESSCYLLLDDSQNPHSVFTGDTLFVGDVGRPDLAAQPGISREQLAGILFDSIQSKILPLPNYVVIYPGHGAGSACGKVIGNERHSTIGIQRIQNYALQAENREEFVSRVIDGLTEPPKYFFMDAGINKHGYRNLEEVILTNQVLVAADQLQKWLKADEVLVVDTRSALTFATSFIPSSINIGIDGSFAITAGSVLDPQQPLVLVTDPGREKEAITRLARIGFENVKGILEGGVDAWLKSGFPTDTIDCISAEEFEMQFRFNQSFALDVRNPAEWIPGFVAGAKLIPLSKLTSEVDSLDPAKLCYVYCGGGYRSMVAASILKRSGFRNVKNVNGGMFRIRQTKIPVRQLSKTAS